MRVLQLLSSTGFHGAESMAAALVRELATQGVTVDIAVFDNRGTGDDTIFEAVGDAARHRVRLPCDGQLDRRTFAALGAHVHTHGVDVIHSHKYKTTFYAGLMRRRLGVGLLSTYHNWITTTPALRAYALLDKQLARFNHVSVGVSTPVCDALRRVVRADRVAQIDNGIEVERFARVAPRAQARRQLGLPEDGPLAGFVGRLSSEKGLEVLLDALEAAGPRAPRLALVGDGPLRGEIEARVAQGPLRGRVHLLGHRTDTPWVYAALDLLVLPSWVEAYPMVLLEAMAAGCPVIATEVGEVGRMVRPDENGLLVRAGDRAGLARALADLGDDGPRRERLGQAGLAWVRAHGSSADMARRYGALYARAAREAGRSAQTP